MSHVPLSTASDLFTIARATHALVVNLCRKADQLEKMIMSAQDEFKAAETQMLAALKAELASRAQAISGAVAKAQAAWEADDEAGWKQAAQDMKDAGAAIQAASGSGFTPSGNVPAGG